MGKGENGKLNDIEIDSLIDEIVGLYSEIEKCEIQTLKEKCRTEFKTDNKNIFFYEGDRFSDSVRNSLTGEDKKRNEEELLHAIVLADKLFKIFMPQELHSVKNKDRLLKNGLLLAETHRIHTVFTVRQKCH